MYTPLSHPVEAWHFDLRSPPEDSAQKTLDLEFHAHGRMNAVVFWYKLELFNGITFTTGPEATTTGDFCFLESLQLSLMMYKAVQVLGLQCSSQDFLLLLKSA